MVTQVRSGAWLREVGDDYGLTRQRIHQIVTALDPDATGDGDRARIQRRDAARHVAEEAERARRIASNGPCVICWGPIERVLKGNAQRSQHKTCSPRCGDLWRLVRYQLDLELKERHRLLMARWHIEHPDVNGAIGVRHAVAVLTGTARRYMNHPAPSGQLAAALAEVAELRADRAAPPGALPLPSFELVIAHGTTTGYKQGCRQACCREAKTAKERARRARKRTARQLAGEAVT